MNQQHRDSSPVIDQSCKEQTILQHLGPTYGKKEASPPLAGGFTPTLGAAVKPTPSITWKEEESAAAPLCTCTYD